MSSIRQRLTIWLLGGLAILWVATSLGIYAAVRQSLLKSLDAEIAVDSRIVRFASRSDEPQDSSRKGARQVQERMSAYHEVGSGVYYQVWTSEGEIVERSVSLGELALEFPEGLDSEPKFATKQLADGTSIRVMSFRSVSGSKGKGKGRRGTSVTALAKETVEVDRTLRSLVSGIGLVGILGALGAVFLVRTGLNQGLKPLTKLGEQVAAIDASKLGSRFPDDDLPAELLPISERLNQLLERLDASFERERRFSSDLAHEIRTPIAELKTMSEVALKWPEESGAKTHEESLEIACQLERMVENLLALARWESGQLTLKEESIPLASFLEKAWEPFAKLAQEKGIEVSVKGDENFSLQSDRGMLQHIVTNLFSNAVEYTPDRGKIAITCSETGIQVSNSVENLEEDEVAHLFDRFWRGDASRTDSNHAGLGLALAKSCAEALGMTLEASLKKNLLTFALSRERTP